MAVKKKAIDTWKTKQWFSLVAPKLFNEAEVAQVPAQDPQHLLNRIIELPLKEITKELAHMYINVKLRVEDVRGKNAYTKFIGHALAREHVQALGRRNRSMLYLVLSTKSADGVEFSVKALVVTNGKASAAQRQSLRQTLREYLSQKIAKQDFGKFIQEVLYGKVSSELNGVLKKIYPIKRVELYKTQLVEVFDVENVEESEQHAAPAQTEATQAEETQTQNESTTMPEESEIPAENTA